MAKAVLSNKNKVNIAYIKPKKINNLSIYQKQNNVKITQDLPFRIKFTNIGIEGYGPNDVPPIGLAVIGLNNYIL